MARAALNWTVRDLAAATGLHRNTITNIEVGRYVGDPETLALIKGVLVREGVQFIDENGGGSGFVCESPATANRQRDSGSAYRRVGYLLFSVRKSVRTCP